MLMSKEKALEMGIKPLARIVSLLMHNKHRNGLQRLLLKRFQKQFKKQD